MVEIVGETMAAISMLSKPMILSSCGTRRPKRRAARSAAMANTSDMAKMAFGRLELLRSWQIEEYPMS